MRFVDSDRARLSKINDALVQAERQFIDPRGLRGRAWYKHQIYAPGFYTGYAAQPLTDFRQALDDRNSANAKESLERIVEAIKRVTNTLRTSAVGAQSSTRLLNDPWSSVDPCATALNLCLLVFLRLLLDFRREFVRGFED